MRAAGPRHRGKKRKSKGGREKEKIEEYKEMRQRDRVVHNGVSEYI